jgi:hypothetical protein
MTFKLTFKELQLQSPKLNKYWEENSEWIGKQVIDAYNSGRKSICLTINTSNEQLEFIAIKLKELGYNVKLEEFDYDDTYQIEVKF